MDHGGEAVLRGPSLSGGNSTGGMYRMTQRATNYQIANQNPIDYKNLWLIFMRLVERALSFKRLLLDNRVE